MQNIFGKGHMGKLYSKNLVGAGMFVNMILKVLGDGMGTEKHKSQKLHLLSNLNTVILYISTLPLAKTLQLNVSISPELF